jgi:hypothetical protein
MHKLPSHEIVNLTDARMPRAHNEDRHAAEANARFALRPDKPTAYSPQAMLFQLAWQAGTPMLCALRMPKAAHGGD